MRCSATCSGSSAGAPPPGATCATRWSWISKRRRWAARRSSCSSAPRTARCAAAPAPRAGTRGWSPARAAAARASSARRRGFSPAGATAWAAAAPARCRACAAPTCEGAGLVDRERRYTVRIPPASTGGSTQRVPREGGPGRRGGPPGDLHVIVRVRPHPFFTREATREGDVLMIEVPLSPVEATLGAEIDVPVLDGRVRMRVPPGTQAGSQFRLRGKGFPRARARAATPTCASWSRRRPTSRTRRRRCSRSWARR